MKTTILKVFILSVAAVPVVLFSLPTNAGESAVPKELSNAETVTKVEPVEVSEVTTPPTQTVQQDPVEVTSSPAPSAPTYDDLMVQYGYNLDPHMKIIVDSMLVQEPERFTPDVIESSFARISEVFTGVRDSQRSAVYVQFRW